MANDKPHEELAKANPESFPSPNRDIRSEGTIVSENSVRAQSYRRVEIRRRDFLKAR
jgi:hypothetical protein